MNNKMFGATLLSGVLSGITFLMVPGALFVGPGILFGLGTAWFFQTNKWLDTVQAFLWVIASTAAWYAAIETYLAYGSNPALGGVPGGRLTNMLIAGLVGSGLIAVVLSLLVRRISFKNIIVTVVSSVILAAFMNVILTYGSGIKLGDPNSIQPYVRLAAAFTIWQAGIGFSLLAYKPKRLR